MALLGGIVGAAVGYGILALLDAPVHAGVPTAVGAFVFGAVVAVCSSLIPITWWRRAPLAERLVEL